MKSLVVRFLAAALAVGTLSGSALLAADDPDQKFTVKVLSSLSISAPSDPETLVHNETDDPQQFPVQTWTVKGNNLAGVNVTFTAATPFQMVTNPEYKRNVELGLALKDSQGPATWLVTKASGATNYVDGTNSAEVSCTSDKPGRARFDLTVKFVTETYGVFPAGDYVTTVTGTIAAK